MLAFMKDLNQLQEDAKSAGDEATEYSQPAPVYRAILLVS